MFADRFAAVILISAPIDVLIERVSTRTNNPYGKTAAERETIRRNAVEIEPLLRASATFELDGRRPVAESADAVERLLGRRGVPGDAAR